MENLVKKTKYVTCYACGGKRHFARMCNSKVKKVHVLLEDNEDNSEDEREEVFLLQGKNDATLSLPLQGKIINILIDSGASTNVIDKSTYEQVKTTENCLSKSNAKIYPYGSKIPLDLLGKTKLKMQIGGSEHEIDFQVTKGTGKPLIGRKSATKLGLLHIGMINTLSLDQANIPQENTDTIIRSFEDRFKGTGRLKDFQLDLHVDKSVTPVAQPLHQIPFKMRTQVENKIAELEKNDIIEKTSGPTPWVSNVVAVPKQNNRVRLSIDMRQANKAILRDRFPMPNIDETLQQMNGASIFSRLDLTEAFHQIELSESSRYITTFVCHKGLYRYKRLNYGISSASELFQRILQQILQDIPNCKNIVDDIIIYADNREDHDKVLKMVLTRLREMNLALNRSKCEFNKSELKFMGHILSSRGIQIDESKMKAVRDAEPPKNTAEVLSFLGLVTFCASS